MEWVNIPLPSQELDLDLTLSSGQAFRWVSGKEGEWCGTIGERFFVLRRHGNVLQYQVTPPTSEASSIVRQYFRLDSDLSALYREWSEDVNFREKALWCQGIRLLQQPTAETLISFICSANNNIPRISRMVRSFCELYGERVTAIEGDSFYSFPSIKSLVGVVSEAALRDVGFGYRAKYVKGSVEEMQRRGGEEWLSSLHQLSYEEAWTQLQQLPGVGAKVADCVCLMGLGHLQAVPVDVHVLRLARRDYSVGHTSRGLTAATYRAVGNEFRAVFGKAAGWAQAVLFTAELQRQQHCKPLARARRGEGEREGEGEGEAEGEGEGEGEAEDVRGRKKRLPKVRKTEYKPLSRRRHKRL